MAAHLVAPEPDRATRSLAGLVVGGAAVGLALLVIGAAQASLGDATSIARRALIVVAAIGGLGVSARRLPGAGWRASGSARIEAAGIVLVIVLSGVAVALGDREAASWVQLATAIPWLAWGAARVAQEATAAGQAWRPEMLRSADFSAVVALLFGGQVVLAMALSTGPTGAMLALLLGVIALAIVGQTLWAPYQDVVERLAYARWPRLRAVFSASRAANLAQRVNAEPPALAHLDESASTRLTRRALSDLGDVPRLARSPLIHLASVGRRVDDDPATPRLLARAAQLQALLRESIDHLRPPGGADPAPTREWRHFNALYFPYVVGLRPYSRRFDPSSLDVPTRAVADWFRIQVPERTLHNWQNEAARLIASELRNGVVAAT